MSVGSVSYVNTGPWGSKAEIVFSGLIIGDFRRDASVSWDSWDAIALALSGQLQHEKGITQNYYKAQRGRSICKIINFILICSVHLEYQFKELHI